jgi:hypothetical protein
MLYSFEYKVKRALCGQPAGYAVQTSKWIVRIWVYTALTVMSTDMTT